MPSHVGVLSFAACRHDYTAERAEARFRGTSPDHLTHYVVVRADLPRGVQAAMLVHAAGESSPGGLPEGTFAVVLAARDELHIALIAERLESKGIRLTRVVEPDPPWNGALMAIGCEPGRKDAIGRWLSDVPLLK